MIVAVLIVVGLLVVSVAAVSARRRSAASYDAPVLREPDGTPLEAPDYDTLLHHDRATGRLVFEHGGVVTVHDVRVWLGGDTTATPDHVRERFDPGESFTLPLDLDHHGLVPRLDERAGEESFGLHVELRATRADGREERSWWDTVWVE